MAFFFFGSFAHPRVHVLSSLYLDFTLTKTERALVKSLRLLLLFFFSICFLRFLIFTSFFLFLLVWFLVPDSLSSNCALRRACVPRRAARCGLMMKATLPTL